MYQTFYKLRAEPFRLSPDHRFCFQHRTYRKAMTYMRHALHRAEGFIMITGRPGTGKTTLIHDLLRTIKPGQLLVANLVTTQMTADDLIRLVAYSYHLDPEGADKVDVLIRLVHFLKKQHKQGRRPLLIVDEAQGMAEGALEELRLLTNLQTGGQQLLQIFLVGQEQLRDMVNAPSMEQLHQRMIAATHLEPLDRHDTEAYIKHRLRRVAWTGDPLISKEAYAMIQQYSQGIPRQINQICSRLFLHGSIEEKHRLGIADIKIVVEELRDELLMSMESAENAAAVPWPADPHQESYEEEPRRPAAPAPAAPKSVPQATPTTPPTTKTQQETEPAPQGSTTGAPATPPSLPENEPAAAASPAASNNQNREQQAAMTAIEPSSNTPPVQATTREQERPAAGMAASRENAAEDISATAREPSSDVPPEQATTREQERPAAGMAAPREKAAGDISATAREPSADVPPEQATTREQERPAAGMAAPRGNAAEDISAPAGEPSADIPPEQATTREQERPAAGMAAPRGEVAENMSAVELTVRVPDQATPGKKQARKPISWGLLGLTGLITGTGLAVAFMYITKPELTRNAGQNLITWLDLSIQKVAGIATGESSPDSTEPGEEMGKGTVLREPPAVSHETKPEAADIKTAAQQPDRVLPQASTVQLEEQLQQSGLLVERMDDDILKVNLSSDGMFAFDSAELKDGARPALGKLADVLRKQDERTIQVVGHTDSSGAAEYNLYLSQRRAKAVADYLIGQGLNDASIQSEGRGDRDTRLEQPAIYNPGLKRRVEIYISRAQ